MSKLVNNVHVMNDDTSEFEVFGPDDDVPEWAAEKMGAHCFEDGKHPFPNADYPDKKVAKADAPDESLSGVPARAGRGSSLDAWKAFAAENDVEVDEAASRDEIIAACVAAGVIEE